jgi:hypothetical protein
LKTQPSHLNRLTVLPNELIKIFDNYDSEDFSLCITHVDYSTEDFVVNFDINSQGIGELQAFDMKWALCVTGHKTSKISFDFGAIIDIREVHPLLWNFDDTQCELYFNGQCQDIAKLFVDMYEIHYKLFGNYSPFETYLISHHLYPLMQGKNGLLARGPKKLLTKYAECVKKHGLDFSIISERPPVYWNGKSFIPEPPNLKILFLTETATYIIAQDFIFSRQNK